jgi:drug/metabolite transporter (DMT)-like permease
MAIHFISGSTFHLMRSGALIITILFSYCFIGVPFKRHQKLGLVVMLVAVIVASLSELIQEKVDNVNQLDKWWVGILLMLVAIIISGMYYAF